MKRHGNLWPKIISLDNIRLAYKKARRGKSRLYAVRKFEQNEEENLLRVQRELTEKTFRTSPYHEKMVWEPKPRKIYVLPFAPDRIVQHALMNIVEPIWDNLLVDQSCSCRTGKGTKAGYDLAAVYVRRFKYCLKCDIRKYYPSISHDLMMAVVRRKIKCPDTLRLIEEIVRSFPGDKNIPIGNYTSQWLANIFLNNIDRWALQELKVAMVRYSDDICFFSNDKDVLNMIKGILPLKLLKENNLTLSKMDLFPVARGVDFLGYRFFPNGVVLLRKRVAKVTKKRMASVRRAIEFGRNPVHFRSHISSAIGTFKICNSYNLKQSMGLPELAQAAGIKTKWL